jgi:hypothetical protein
MFKCQAALFLCLSKMCSLEYFIAIFEYMNLVFSFFDCVNHAEIPSLLSVTQGLQN